MKNQVNTNGFQAEYIHTNVKHRLLKLQQKSNMYSEIRERMYFTFYPILAQWGYVRFKYSTELYFHILKWMKQHLMSYYKTILNSSKLSYISDNQVINVPTRKWSKRHTSVIGGFFKYDFIPIICEQHVTFPEQHIKLNITLGIEDLT